MAEQVEQEQVAAQAQCEEEDDDVDTPGYKAPAFKSVNELEQLDKDDESLVKYKKTLLGGDDGDKIVDEKNPSKVILKSLSILVEGRPPLEMDLTKVLDENQKYKVVLKEGCEYVVQISFYVQREIVCGLKYFQAVYRKGIKVDKASCMLGSYGPCKELRQFKTPEETAPSGMIARGEYKVKSKFLDDDKNVHMEWEWHIEIKKDFE